MYIVLEKKRKSLKCSCCKEEIYYENEKYDQDPCFQIDGNILCEDCVMEYVEKHCSVSLMES